MKIPLTMQHPSELQVLVLALLLAALGTLFLLVVLHVVIRALFGPGVADRVTGELLTRAILGALRATGRLIRIVMKPLRSGLVGRLLRWLWP